MNEKIEQFHKFIEQKILECNEKEKKLISEERKDEANICRVRANIFDIFRTLMNVSVQQEERNGFGAICRSFEIKADKIPMNWKISYEKAKEHNDVEKILVEEEKLAAAKEVMAYYEKQIK